MDSCQLSGSWSCVGCRQLIWQCRLYVGSQRHEPWPVEKRFSSNLLDWSRDCRDNMRTDARIQLNKILFWNVEVIILCCNFVNVIAGYSELMRLLIYSGLNPHQQDHWQQTPLHLSCIKGDLTAIRELCELVRQSRCSSVEFTVLTSVEFTEANNGCGQVSLRQKCKTKVLDQELSWTQKVWSWDQMIGVLHWEFPADDCRVWLRSQLRPNFGLRLLAKSEVWS